MSVIKSLGGVQVHKDPEENSKEQKNYSENKNVKRKKGEEKWQWNTNYK